MKLGKLIAQSLDLYTQCPELLLNQSNWIAEKLMKAPQNIKQQIITELLLQPNNEECPCIGCHFEDAWPGCPQGDACNWSKTTNPSINQKPEHDVK